MNRKILAIAAMSALFVTLSGCAGEDKNIKKDVGDLLSLVDIVEAKVPPIPVNYEWSYNQNWTQDQSKWFWHVPQGTYQIPYAWFVSLEKPLGTRFRSNGKSYAPIEFIQLNASNAKLGESEEFIDKDVLKSEKALSVAPAEKLLGNDRSNLFIDNNYLAGFGVIPVQYPSKDNPDALPLGLTRFDKFVDPRKKDAKPQVVMGFSCALCHTARIDYRGKSMIIDGAPSQANLGFLVGKLGVSLGETLIIPTRFNRFAQRVYGHSPSDAEKNALRAEIIAFAVSTAKQYSTPPGSTDSGYGRLDALTTIGNVVFGEADLNAPENSRPANAPVSYPMIWTVPWLAWAEYPGVVEQPMVRNVGEALGVFAPVNLTGRDPKDIFKSTVQVGTMYRAETLLMEGVIPWDITKPTPDPYKYIDKNKALPGLNAPKWPVDMFGAIDPVKAKEGAGLYTELCQGCHLPPLSSPDLYKRDAKGNLNLKYWTAKNRWGKQYLNVVNVGVEEIGTDNTEMMNFYTRTANTSNLTLDGAATQNGVKKLGTYLSAADGLQTVTAAVANQWYFEQGIVTQTNPKLFTPKEHEVVDMLNGYRDNVVNMTPPTYRARPLNGIWATASYLHNGSVPNLYQLFIPASERATKFITGRKEYDPVNVGYATCFDDACLALYKEKGYSIFSVKDFQGNAIAGNSNAGHEFKGDGKTNIGEGVVGRALTEKERWDIIEYLKTL